MKKYLLLYLLPLFLYGCTDSVDELDGKGDIYGVVVESTTANPVRAAGVSLYIQDETMPSLLLKTVTYDDGHFEFNKIKSGQYILIVEMEGYKEEGMYITVEAGRTARADMQLKKIETGLTVITSAAIVDGKNVQFKGSFGYTSGKYPSEWGFVYGMEQNPSLTYDEVISTTTVQNKNFEAEIQDVDKGVYYVRAYAKNSNGVSYGANLSFEVKSLPIVSTLDVTNIGDHTATLNGKIVSKGDPAYYEKGFVYSKDFPKPTIDDPSSSTKRVPVSGNSDDFSANIADLSTNSEYNVRAYAISDDETVYGDVISFVATSYVPYVVIDGLAVQRSDSSNGTNWETAVDLCKQSRVGRYSDWHLPSLSELTLMYVNKNKIGDFYARLYWSSTLNGSFIAGKYYYAVNFSSGETSYPRRDEMCRVRCVRTIN